MEKNYIKFVREKIPSEKILLISCCAIIANENGDILLQQRSDNQLWGLPGGLKELNESLIDCVKREVLEETNLTIEVIDFVGVYINPEMSWFEHDKAEVVGFGFEAKIKSGTLKVNDSESLQFGYFNLDNLPQIHAIDNLLLIKDYFNGRRGSIEGKFF